MRIAIVGGGASGLVTAYYLDKQGHQVTILEKQLRLGGHICTLNKNIWAKNSDCAEILEAGVLEFPSSFIDFRQLMTELGVELEPVRTASALFLQDGRHFLSAGMIEKNFTGWQRFREYLRLETLYARSAAFWIKTRFSKSQDFYNQPLAHYLSRPCIRNCWLKLLIMYSYSMRYQLIDSFPAELAIAILQGDVFVDWLRIKGGVYSYIEKILNRFTGKIHLNTAIQSILRTKDSVEISFADGVSQRFDKVVFATPPDQVLALLSDPTEAETRRFGAWQANQATTIIHHDTTLYDRYGITNFSEFDFFQLGDDWGYNAYLNQLCGISAPRRYSLAFNLESRLDPDRIIHHQPHHTPLYTVPALEYRREIRSTNGENHTYHGGAYLGDGLHEGAIASALEVAELLD